MLCNKIYHSKTIFRSNKAKQKKIDASKNNNQKRTINEPIVMILLKNSTTKLDEKQLWKERIREKGEQ